MGKYSKAYGGLIGALLGVAGVHGVLPDEVAAQAPILVNTAIPILFTILGTIFAPKNTN